MLYARDDGGITSLGAILFPDVKRVGWQQFPLGVNLRDKDAPNASSVQVTWSLLKGMVSLSLRHPFN